MTISGTAVGTDQLQVFGYVLDISVLVHYLETLTQIYVVIQCFQAVLNLPDISVSVDPSAITINCSKSQLPKVLQKNEIKNKESS